MLNLPVVVAPVGLAVPVALVVPVAPVAVDAVLVPSPPIFGHVPLACVPTLYPPPV